MSINIKVNTFALEIWDDECAKCTFYTVRQEGESNEADKFFERFENDTEYSDATKELLIFILKTIGEKHGAHEALFNREENEVTGLPNKGKERIGSFTYQFFEFPLRIYAIKLRENLVVLFNGGIKDGPTNQTSSLHMEWRTACEYAKRIDTAIREKEIEIFESERLIRSYNGSSEIWL